MNRYLCFIIKLSSEKVFVPSYTAKMQLILLMTSLCIYAADALIGLRPLSGIPHYLRNDGRIQQHSHPYSESIYKTQKSTSTRNHHSGSFATDSLNKFAMQRTYRNHTVSSKILHKVQEIQDSLSPSNLHHQQQQQTHGGHYNNVHRNNVRCHPIAVNRCGIQFLKGVLHNATNGCDTIQGLEKCLLDRSADLDDRNIHFLMKDIRNVQTSTINCPTVKHHFQGYKEPSDPLALCEENMLQCSYLIYKELLLDRKSCDPLTKFTSCIARAIGYKSDRTASKIFNSIMSLTRTCVHVRLR